MPIQDSDKAGGPMGAGGRLGVVYRPLADLRLDPNNPRTHSRKQIRQIAQSIEAFGFNVPVLLDQDDRVLAGHGRILACQALGRTEVPTIRLTHLTEAQARAFLIADNKLTENAEWDQALLGQQLKTLAALDLSFDLETTGFEMPEIDLLIEGLAPAGDPTPDSADELGAPPAGPVVTRPGDCWALDDHRILCGNALEEEAYGLLMGSQQAAVVFADPPYNLPIAGHVSGLGQITHREFPMASGEMDEAAFRAFLTEICTRLASRMTDGALCYLCMDWRHLGELIAAARAVFSELKNLCVWDKEIGGMGSLYRSQHELILVCKHGTAPHRNNVRLGQHGRYRTNVWRYPGANSFAQPKEEGNLLALHPTVKPVALVADVLLDASGRGDLVLDPFLGSGTTVLAAERTGRVCYGLELDPRYVDTAVRRWQAWTGESARHTSSGRAFDEQAEEGGHDAQPR